jgi:tight adherence protein C
VQTFLRLGLSHWPLLLAACSIVVSASAAAWLWIRARERRDVLRRLGGAAAADVAAEPLLRGAEQGLAERAGEWVARRFPQTNAEELRQRLVRAGFDRSSATGLFRAAMVASLVVFPLVALAAAPFLHGQQRLGALLLATVLGVAAPTAVLDRITEARQVRLRRSLPDVLDLLVVCVEAGVALDASIMRVARELARSHPELAGELAIVVRKINAGMPREEVLQGLGARTGVDELRLLATNLIQAERLGTSVGRVLRVNADTLREKRRRAAEKRAAQASIKMLLPLVLFLLPALMAVVVGPAFLKLAEMP